MIYNVKLFSNYDHFIISAPIPDFNYYSILKSAIDTRLGVFYNKRALGLFH
jgi:multimeric flavodoxin WrbA